MQHFAGIVYCLLSQALAGRVKLQSTKKQREEEAASRFVCWSMHCCPKGIVCASFCCISELHRGQNAKGTAGSET